MGEQIEKERAEERQRHKQELDEKEELLLALKGDREIGLQNLEELKDFLTYEKIRLILWKLLNKATDTSRKLLDSAGGIRGYYNLSSRFWIPGKHLESETLLKEIIV